MVLGGECENMDRREESRDICETSLHETLTEPLCAVGAIPLGFRGLGNLGRLGDSLRGEEVVRKGMRNKLDVCVSLSPVDQFIEI